MIMRILIASLSLGLLAGTASAACDKNFDDISKVISGHLNASTEQRASMMRLAISSYDYCMAGDTASASKMHDMLMAQLKLPLGHK